ncbi:MAG: NAD(P)-dependent oxidoreductase [Ectothiorhodospiraceae bacterium]|nr:NAD(P)-dependent oxidoreductase [Ectothiorhodospiraceae bacterium]
MQNITGQTVFLTGCSAGIGKACAYAFAGLGARLILTARREERLNEIAADIQQKHGVETLIRTLDVRDKEAVFATIEGLPTDWQNIDILVNNAGLARGTDKLQDIDPDVWDEVLDTNVKGLLAVTRAIVPGMKARGKGHIINIGSIAGHEAYPGGSVYNASKFAVDAITKSLRMDLVETPLRVGTVDPGLVETEFSMVRFRGDADKAKSVYKGIDACTPDDVADAVVYIATRPPHVSINQIVVMPTAQASALVMHRQ